MITITLPNSPATTAPIRRPITDLPVTSASANRPRPAPQPVRAQRSTRVVAPRRVPARPWRRRRARGGPRRAHPFRSPPRRVAGAAVVGTARGTWRSSTSASNPAAPNARRPSTAPPPQRSPRAVVRVAEVAERPRPAAVADVLELHRDAVRVVEHELLGRGIGVGAPPDARGDAVLRPAGRRPRPRRTPPRRGSRWLMDGVEPRPNADELRAVADAEDRPRWAPTSRPRCPAW